MSVTEAMERAAALAILVNLMTLQGEHPGVVYDEEGYRAWLKATARAALEAGLAAKDAPT